MRVRDFNGAMERSFENYGGNVFRSEIAEALIGQ